MNFSRGKHKAKRSMIFPVLLVLLVQLIFPGTAWAGGPAQVDSSQPSKEPAITLEKAISIVKENFEIPQEYTKFSSGLNMNNQIQTWLLNWSSTDQSNGNFSAQVDINTGEIMNMNNWKNDYKQGPSVQIPTIQASEATDIATKLVKRLAGTKLTELQLMPMSNNIIPLSSYGPASYTVHWQRLVNGIPFPNNGVTVQVNVLTGEIQSYSMDWLTLTKIPELKGAISPSQAEERFLANPMFELQYFSSIRPLNPGENQDVKLVYQMNNSYFGGAIDALTGEPIKISDGGYYPYGKVGYDGMGGAASTATQPAQPKPLTPAEQTEIDKSANLLSQDDAVAIIKRWVSIPDNLVLSSSNLSTYGIAGDRHVWNLNWDDSKTSLQPQYVNAGVDAATGELLNFNLPYPVPENNKPAIDRNQTQKIAEDFLKLIEPNHFSEVKLADDYYLAQGVPPNGPQSFYYYRIVNGIPYRTNGINIMVDPVSKKIFSYNLNWNKQDFPQVSDILDSNQVSANFLKAEPLKLIYTQIFNPGQPGNQGEVKLVYQPTPTDGTPVSNIMDAKTGEFLDWQGTPSAQTPMAYYFTDITDSFAQKEIALLGQAGIFGEYRDQFHPDEEIKTISLLKALLALNNGYPMPISQSDQDIIKNAMQQGWLTEDVDPAAVITREDFAKLMIRFLKLEPVAKLQGVYEVSYSDVDSDFGGYAALAKGIGMFNIDGDAFDKSHIMTRAEAAYALVKAIVFRT